MRRQEASASRKSQATSYKLQATSYDIIDHSKLVNNNKTQHKNIVIALIQRFENATPSKIIIHGGAQKTVIEDKKIVVVECISAESRSTQDENSDSYQRPAPCSLYFQWLTNGWIWTHGSDRCAN
jgi:hypothetical protein